MADKDDSSKNNATSTDGSSKSAEEDVSKGPKQYFKCEETHFELSPYVKDKNAEEDAPPTVLDPSHPLLAKFQQALKEYFKKHIAHLKDEIFELETGAKKKNAEREQMGVEAYETQQVVAKQQEQLETCVAELQNISAARQEVDCELQEAFQAHKKESERLLEAKKNETELKTEVESMNLLLQQMSRWEDSVEHDLRVNQRVYEKTKKDKIKLAEDKRKQDMFIYKIMTEVWKLEGELETINMQLRVKEEERVRLAQTIAVSNTEIEAAEAEHRCLLHGWHSVVVAISSRDKHYTSIRQELSELNETLRSLLSEIDQAKKMCRKEMNQNESLTMFKNRIEADNKNCAHLLEGEVNKKNATERTLMQIQGIVEQTEADIKKLQYENNCANVKFTQLRREHENLLAQKHKMEEEALTMLQDQLSNDKAAKYLNKLSGDLRSKNRLLEINLFHVENVNAAVLMDIEGQKGINLKLQSEMDEWNSQLDAIEKKMNEYEEEISKYKSSMNKKQRDIDMLNKKISFLIMKCGKEEKSPHELKVSALEQHIDVVLEKIKDLQKFWLREQGHVVCLCEQRQEQIHDSNLLRKQCMIFEQRNLKINDELNMHKKNEEQMTRSINKLQNQLSSFTEVLNKKKDSKNFLDESNNLLQSEFHAKLKDFELDIIKLESEITEIEEDSALLTKELLESNREALEWEKKYQMTLETKQNMDRERGTGGEVGNMRAEIHRMTVRYDQLKKAQQKLILDLEHCVARRDSIVTNAEAREKRGPGTQSKINFHRKLDDTRNKLKQMQNEVEDVENKIKDLEEEERNVNELISMKQKDIEEVTVRNEDMRQQIELNQTDKEMNLEILVFKQRQVKILMELSKGRKPFLLYKTDVALRSEYDKQMVMNSKLLKLIQKLTGIYPAHCHSLQRIFNTLKLPTVPV